MKTLSLVPALLALALVASCSDDTPPTVGTPVAPAGTMTALLNGASYASESGASSSAEYLGLDTGQSNNRQLSIFGRKGGNEELAVTIYRLNGAGTYTLGDQKAQGLGSYVKFNAVDSLTQTYGTNNAYTGSITISKFDTAARKVSGSFRFTAAQLRPLGATGTMKVLDGSFTDLPMTIR